MEGRSYEKQMNKHKAFFASLFNLTRIITFQFPLLLNFFSQLCSNFLTPFSSHSPGLFVVHKSQTLICGSCCDGCRNNHQTRNTTAVNVSVASTDQLYRRPFPAGPHFKSCLAVRRPFIITT